MKLRDQLRELKIQQFLFDIFVLEAQIKLKFPCTFFLTWKLDKQTSKKTENLPTINNKVTFHTSLSIRTEMTYNNHTKLYLEKKLQICINLNSLTRQNSTNLAGVVTIDLAKCIQPSQVQQLKTYKLQRCPDKSSSITFSIKNKFIRQVRSIDINESLAELRANTLNNSLVNSRISQKMNNNFQNSLNISNEYLLRSPSQKIIQYSTNEQQFQKTVKNNISINIMEKKRNNIVMTNSRELRQVQQIKFFNQKQKQTKILKSTYPSDIYHIPTQDHKKTMIRSTKQQINNFHQELLKEINRVKQQQEFSESNRTSRKPSPEFSKVVIKEEKLQANTKNSNQKQKLEIQLKQQKQHNEILKKELNKAENQLIFLRYSNSQSTFKINQKQMIIKMLKQNVQNHTNPQYQKQISVLKQKISQYEHQINCLVEQKSEFLTNQKCEIQRLLWQIQKYKSQNNELSVNLKVSEQSFNKKIEQLNDMNKLQIKKEQQLMYKSKELNNCQQKLKLKQGECDKKSQQLKQMERIIKNNDQQIHLIKQQIISKNQQLVNLEIQCRQKQLRLSQTNHKNQQLSKQINLYILSNSNKHCEILKLQQKLQSLQLELQKHKKTNQLLNKKLQELLKDSSDNQNQLHIIINNHQNEINKLNQLLAQKQKINFHKDDANTNVLSKDTENDHCIYTISEKEENSQHSNLLEISHNDEQLNQSIISFKRKEIEEIRELNIYLVTQNAKLQQKLEDYYQKMNKLEQQKSKYETDINDINCSKKKQQIKLYNQIKLLKQQTGKYQNKIESLLVQNMNLQKQISKYQQKIKQFQQISKSNRTEQTYIIKNQNTLKNNNFNKQMLKQSKMIAINQKEILENYLQLIIQLLKTKSIAQDQSLQLLQNLKNYEHSNQNIISSNFRFKFKNQIKELTTEMLKSKLKLLNTFVAIQQKKAIIESFRIIQKKIQKILQMLNASSRFN